MRSYFCLILFRFFFVHVAQREYGENLLEYNVENGYKLFASILSSNKLYTMQYYCITQVGAIDEVTKLKLKLSDLGCYSVIKMIFFDNLVHGDMHPGTVNIHRMCAV